MLCQHYAALPAGHSPYLASACVVLQQVEEEQPKNIKPFYKPGEAAAVPFLPFLVGVVVAMLAATVVVVAKTG